MVVVSVLVFLIGFTSIWRGWLLDTSEATAKKIQPGMTLAEVQEIIGGPPGRYTLSSDAEPQKVSGMLPRSVVEWRTYHGTITVVDGYSGGDGGGPPKGTVDFVWWKPSKSSPWEPWLVIVPSMVAACFLYWMYFWLKTETTASQSEP
jgi:hypothetical protein